MRNESPSYQTGFAPRDGQPLYPELWRGCVGAWAPRMGPTGLTLRDWSGRANHGTLTNMTANTAWVTNRGQYCLNFDATDDSVQCGTIDVSGSLSISAWISVASASGVGVIVEKRPTNSAWMLFLNADAINLRGASVTAVGASFTMLGQWVHVMATITGTTGQIWLNGVLAATGSVTAIANTTGNVTIGRYLDSGGGGTLNGTLSELQIYSRVLSPQEIRLLASRRGIAYELAPRRRSSVQVAAFNRRRRLLIGAGS